MLNDTKALIDRLIRDPVSAVVEIDIAFWTLEKSCINAPDRGHLYRRYTGTDTGALPNRASAITASACLWSVQYEASLLAMQMAMD
jgi:hypothetical protein